MLVLYNCIPGKHQQNTQNGNAYFENDENSTATNVTIQNDCQAYFGWKETNWWRCSHLLQLRRFRNGSTMHPLCRKGMIRGGTFGVNELQCQVAYALPSRFSHLRPTEAPKRYKMTGSYEVICTIDPRVVHEIWGTEGYKGYRRGTDIIPR